jgi:hypothetical protein
VAHSKGYLLFSGITKVGRLSPASLKKIGSAMPEHCKVTEANTDKKVLSVEFQTKP